MSDALPITPLGEPAMVRTPGPPVTIDPAVASPGTRAWRRVSRNSQVLVGGAGLLFLFLFSVAGPWVYRVDPEHLDYLQLMNPPSGSHPLGTDEVGRDLLARLMHGGRISLAVGVTTALVAVVVGTLAGAAAGYFGRLVDVAISRLVDMLLTVPSVPAVMVIGAFVKVTPPLLIGVIAAFQWMRVARLVRGEFLRLKREEFALAARGIGASSGRVVLRHLLPNALAPVVVISALIVAYALLIEATLSFLGFGVQPPTPTWGNMLTNAQESLAVAPRLALLPGLMISVTVMSVTFIGDGIREILDPRLVHDAR